jgi:hypothetical protein
MTSWTDNISLQYIMVRFNLFLCLVSGVKRHFQQYFSYIVAVSFIGGGNPEKTYLFTLSSDIEDQRKY